MAQVTALHTSATPGPARTFWPKPLVRGPYRLDAGRVFHTGAAAGALFVPGAVAGRVFHTGAAAGALFVPGAVAGRVFHPGTAKGSSHG